MPPSSPPVHRERVRNSTKGDRRSKIPATREEMQESPAGSSFALMIRAQFWPLSGCELLSFANPALEGVRVSEMDYTGTIPKAEKGARQVLQMFGHTDTSNEA